MKSGFIASLQRHADRSSRWIAVLFALSIPLSVALDNLLLALLLLLGLVAHLLTAWRMLVEHPVARAAMLLFAALLVGCVYSEAPLREALGVLWKYIDLAFIPLLMAIFRDDVVRRRAMNLFLVVMAVTALLSWLVGLQWLPVQEWMWRGATAENPAIFRSPITHNILMAYAAYLLLLRLQDAGTMRSKAFFAGMTALAAGNVLFMVQGRTGYLVLAALIVYFAGQMLMRRLSTRGYGVDWRAGAGAAILGTVLIVGAYQISPRLQQRVDQVATEFKAWQPDVRSETSTGLRLEFYYNTLRMIEEQTLLGAGTGAFALAYARQAQGKDMSLTPNPHNEYLLITAQTGVIGLLLLLYLFYVQWRCAPLLPTAFEQDAARGLVLAITITAMFNSPLLDHTEGLFFAFASALLFAGLKTGKPCV